MVSSTAERKSPGVVTWLSSTVESRLPMRLIRYGLGDKSGISFSSARFPSRGPVRRGQAAHVAATYSDDDRRNSAVSSNSEVLPSLDLVPAFYFDGQDGQSSAASSRPTTPASSSTATLVPLGSLTPVAMASTVATSSLITTTPSSSSSQHHAHLPPNPPIGPIPSIDPKLREIGMHLLSTAEEERNRHGLAGYNGPLELQAYLDGVRYLIMALPNELGPSRGAALRESVGDLLEKLGVSVDETTGLPVGSCTGACAEGHPHGQQNDYPRTGLPPHQKSILYKATRLAVIQAILLANFLLPYLILLVRCAARAERRHRISEKLVGRSVDLARTLGTQGRSIGGTIAALQGGRLGQVVTEVLCWTVEGVADGFLDGVEEGRTATTSQDGTWPAIGSATAGWRE